MTARADGKQAVLLLSGGLDSTTLLALATQEGYAVNALTFSYGQRHGLEIDRARAVATRYGVLRPRRGGHRHAAVRGVGINCRYRGPERQERE